MLSSIESIKCDGGAMSRRPIVRMAVTMGVLAAGAILAGCAPSHTSTSPQPTGAVKQHSQAPVQRSANPYNYGNGSGSYGYGNDSDLSGSGNDSSDQYGSGA